MAGKIRNLIEKLKWKYELFQLDSFWRHLGHDSWEMYPPSFYYTHTQEEIDRIKAKDSARRRKAIDEL